MKIESKKEPVGGPFRARDSYGFDIQFQAAIQYIPAHVGTEPGIIYIKKLVQRAVVSEKQFPPQYRIGSIILVVNLPGKIQPNRNERRVWQCLYNLSKFGD